MNTETEQPQDDYYRLDVHLDGNGAQPHMVYKSTDVRRLLESAWKLSRREDTLWLLWKVFIDVDMTRHLDTICPSLHKSLDEIVKHVMERDASIGKPIPVPEIPPEKWV